VLVVNDTHLQKVLDEYCAFFNRARSHQGIGQRKPATADQPALVASSAIASGAASLTQSSAAFITTTGSPHDNQSGGR
jgi:hypothetical protein